MAVSTTLGTGSWVLTAACCVGLGVVGARSRARVRRRRQPEAVLGLPGRYPSSPTTLLAGWAGVGLIGMAVAGTVPGRAAPLARLALGTAGVLVAWTGFASRVVGLEVRPDGLVVHHRLVRPFHLRWTDVRRVVAPVTFVGGWRLVGRTGSRTLMPSDLLGHEFVLDLVVVRGGLTRSGRSWARPAPVMERSARAGPT